MGLYKKGIYEVVKKLVLTEKFISEYFLKLNWTYKQVMGFLFFRSVKLTIQKEDKDYVFVDHVVYVNIKTICYKILISETTLLKWVKSNPEIRSTESSNIMKVDIISLHTFLQNSYEQYCKYSDNYNNQYLDHHKNNSGHNTLNNNQL